jgi:hypothetical protein
VDPRDAWTALLVVEGAGRLGDVSVQSHETVLLPAAAGPRDWTPDGPSTVLRYGPA